MRLTDALLNDFISNLFELYIDYGRTKQYLVRDWMVTILDIYL